MRSILMVLLLVPSISFAACSLSVRVIENKPRYYQDAQGNWHGLAVELVSALFKQANCKINFQSINWNRALYLLEHGGLDVLLNMSITEQRKKYTHYIGPMSNEQIVLTIAKGETIKANNLDDIKSFPKRIGIVRGVFYGREFSKKMAVDEQFSSKFEYATNAQNFTKLKLNRISGTLSNNFYANHKINTLLSASKFEIHPYIFNDNFVYFGFSKKGVSKKLIVRFEQAYRELKANQVFFEIISKYR